MIQRLFLPGMALTSCWPAMGCWYLTSCEWRYMFVSWCLNVTCVACSTNVELRGKWPSANVPAGGQVGHRTGSKQIQEGLPSATEHRFEEGSGWRRKALSCKGPRLR